MFYIFPNQDTLQLALTMGIVPPTISLHPTTVGVDAKGQFWAEVVNGPKTMQTGLKRLGVEAHRQAPGPGRAVSCWFELLPVQRLHSLPQITNQTPILFLLDQPQHLTQLVGEMLRLGNDRQSYRWLSRADGQTSVLLRVIGPPFYTLLRALEGSFDIGGLGQSMPLRAFVEQSLRVWVEFGFQMPLADKLRVAEGNLLLIGGDGNWQWLDHATFADIYEILQFDLAHVQTDWHSVTPSEKLQVPLRLVPGGASDEAQLWVLREEPMEQLDRLVRDTPNRDLAMLSFAVGQLDDQTTIVVRTRPSKSPRPELILNGTRYQPYSRIPNLFIPIGTSLQPLIRRDLLREMLAPDPTQIVWLHPSGDTSFVPESLPDAAFQPLTEWVNYVIDRQRTTLSEWIQSTEFDFDSFICKDDEQPDHPKALNKSVDKPPAKKNRPTSPQTNVPPPSNETASGKAPILPDPPPPSLPTPDESANNLLRQELASLEAEFVALDGVALDDPRRLAYWPRLGRLNARLGFKSDAMLCRLYVIWEKSEQLQPLLQEWLDEEQLTHHPQTLVERLNDILAKPLPTPSDVQLIAVSLLTLPHYPTLENRLRPSMQQIGQFLVKHDSTLCVRLTWLAWLALLEVQGTDVLALARARDRLLQRLFNDGLSPERDMPHFLRFTNQKDTQHMRQLREWLPRLHQEALRWGASERQDCSVNHPYIDLIFAFVAARLGDLDFARSLQQQAQTRLGQGDEAEQLLLRVYQYRIQQASVGESTTTLLPTEFRDEIDKLSNKTSLRMCPPKYAVEKMFEGSRILEPLDRRDPYRRIRRDYMAQLQAQLDDLPDEKDPNRLAKRIQSILQIKTDDSNFAKLMLEILRKTLPLAPRAGETTAVKLLSLLPKTLDAAFKFPETYRQQTEVIEQAMIIAGHFGQANVVGELVKRFVELIRSQPIKTRPQAIGSTVGACLRTLRKFGLREEALRLLNDFEQLLLQNSPLSKAASHYDPKTWVEVLPSLLHIAVCWLELNETNKAMPVFAETKRILFASLPDSPKERPLAPSYTALAVVYAQSLTALPPEQSLAASLELFGKLDPLPNTGTPASYFSRLHLQIIEAFACAITNDATLLGASTRRWLEEDEFFVRRRIHRDMQRALAGGL